MPKGEEYLIAKDTTLELEKEIYYIVLTARTKEKNPFLAKEICEKEIDTIIAMISIAYKNEIFGDLIYRGWLIGDDKAILQGWVKISDSVQLDSKLLYDELNKIKKNISADSDILERFKLMSRFYSKSLLYQPCEEKFILLWTILEIFPMKNTTNIQPISEYLSKIIGKSPNIIKDKLGIGKLYGLRGDLVHDGKLNIDIAEMGKIFSKLENIIVEIFRCMSGLSYNGSLDKYL